jgi:lipoprotein signal peptidase
MIVLAAGLCLVPALDQLLKLLVLRRLAPAALSLWPLGRLQVVRSRVWLAQERFGLKLAAIWTLWFLAAAMLAVLTGIFPSYRWPAAALLGGSFSHALEITLRGWVVDYVRLRFWPAFNLADVAITVGGLGLLFNAVLTAMEAWS